MSAHALRQANERIRVSNRQGFIEEWNARGFWLFVPVAEFCSSLVIRHLFAYLENIVFWVIKGADDKGSG